MEINVIECGLFALGLLVGSVALFLVLQKKNTDLQRELDLSLDRQERAQQDIEALTVEAERGHHAQAKVAELRARLEEERLRHQEKIETLEKAKTELSNAFRALSAEALDRNNQSFLTLAKETLMQYQQQAQNDLTLRQKSIHEMVTPLKESLQKVDLKLNDLEKVRTSAYDLLRHQVGELMNTQKELRLETANLVKALRAPHVRGRWGEMQLRRVVEMSGLSAHCDFIEQETMGDENGRLRPDMVVRLPAGKRLIIDAKAPLAAYLEALEATDDATRLERLRDHARQVRSHITALSQRQYWDQFKAEETPEFVVLFLPGDTFFNAALEQDPGLIEMGVEKRVILATPATLIALLHAVAYGWRQEKLTENAREISNLGRDLYKRIADMGSHLTRLGASLGQSVNAYNRTVGTLETRVLPAARRFKDLEASNGSLEIEPLSGLDQTVRGLQAPELLASNHDEPSFQDSKHLLT
ncbi:MAG: DNA recombination protein RmuC [Holosporales bacterium]